MTRAEYVAAAKALQGTAYIWGGKQPPGLDCSGLVTWILYALGGPDPRQTHNSDKLWLDLPAIAIPEAGDLAFYGAHDDPSHVVVCLGDGGIIGANGGGRDTTSVEIAHNQRAFVKRKPTPNYRPDFLGFRSTAGWFR